MNDNLSDVTFAEVVYPDNIVTLPANFTGKYYITCIALNNAMDPSDAICSDGISKDTTPPVLHDVVIENARWPERIYCNDNTTWFLRSDLVKLKLENTKDCNRLCETETKWELLNAIPFIDDVRDEIENLQGQILGIGEQMNQKNTSAVSNYLCSIFPGYDMNTIIHLPNDHVILHWNVEDELSQIHEFYVGFGSHESERYGPGLVSYISTDKRNIFKIRHTGIGTDEEFFIFLKAVNKAGLETVLSVGSVMIDETPPHYNTLPTVQIYGDSIVVGWENDTFYDDEQSTPIDRISYEIVSTLLLQLRQWFILLNS